MYPLDNFFSYANDKAKSMDNIMQASMTDVFLIQSFEAKLWTALLWVYYLMRDNVEETKWRGESIDGR